jgi:capsular exopolysaccharide synthesis family protein
MAADAARGSEQPAGVREFLGVLWLRKWSLILVTLVVVGVALAYSFTRTPIYESTAEVLVRPISFDPSQPGTAPGFINMETEERVATSAPVAAAAKELLQANGTRPGEISVQTTTEEVETLEFTALSPDPRAARRTAQAYAQSYLDFREQAVLQDLRAARQPIEAQIRTLDERIAQIERQLSIPGREGGATQAERPGLNLQYSNLLAERTALQTELSNLVAPRDIRVGDILQPAGLPTEPASPDHLQTGAFALFVGLSLGIGLAFLRERMDQRVRDRESLETAAGLPVLGAIPRRPIRRKEPVLVTLGGGPSTESSEGYKALRTSLTVAAARDGWNTIMLTSATPGEGKTSTVANLGVALTRAGKQVILVSADLRRPELHRYFGVSEAFGLRDVLAAAQNPASPSSGNEKISVTALKESLRRVQGVPGLLVLGSGSSPGDPPELLGSEAMQDLLGWLKANADLVLIDTPPVLGMADTTSLAPMVDAVLLVASAGQVREGALQEALHRLEGVEARVIGAVLNKYDPSRTRDYYSSYYYGRRRYGAAAEEERAGLRAVDDVAASGFSSKTNRR